MAHTTRRTFRPGSTHTPAISSKKGLSLSPLGSLNVCLHPPNLAAPAQPWAQGMGQCTAHHPQLCSTCISLAWTPSVLSVALASSVGTVQMGSVRREDPLYNSANSQKGPRDVGTSSVGCPRWSPGTRMGSNTPTPSDRLAQCPGGQILVVLMGYDS